MSNLSFLRSVGTKSSGCVYVCQKILFEELENKPDVKIQIAYINNATSCSLTDIIPAPTT